jgi:hypothetical protein
MEATASLAPDWNAELVDGSEVRRARKLNFQDVRLHHLWEIDSLV